MNIIKELKGIKFTWTEQDGILNIYDIENGTSVDVSRIEMFSLSRFIIRISQKHWHKKKNGKKE